MLRWLAFPLALLLLAPPAGASIVGGVTRALGVPPSPLDRLPDPCGKMCGSCRLGCAEADYVLPACVVGPGWAACWVGWGEGVAYATYSIVCTEGSGLDTQVGVNLDGPSSGCTILA